MEVGSREATRQSQLNEGPLIPRPPPHPQPLIMHVYVCVNSLRPSVFPPIRLESCDVTRAVMHSVKSPAINSGTVLGFPVKHCGSPAILKELRGMSLPSNVFICCRCERSPGSPVHFLSTPDAEIRTADALNCSTLHVLAEHM